MSSQPHAFDLRPGRKLGKRYVIEARIGGGTEGEVYKICELDTGIRRAAKIHYPGKRGKPHSAFLHAQKLNALRFCPIVLQYHHTEMLSIGRCPVLVMISDLCEGEQLETWIARHPGRRLQPYLALHVLYHLARGIEGIHLAGHYHADVHSQNILIQPRGIGFDLKLIDFFDWGRTSRAKQQQDIRDTIAVFHECLGGNAYQHRQSPEIRHIVAGMRRHRMLQRFPSMTALRRHLETFDWKTMVS
jgi:tRNA A-37 threonylcarbamoyl transferase component Bud32